MLRPRTTAPKLIQQKNVRVLNSARPDLPYDPNRDTYGLDLCLEIMLHALIENG